MNRWQTDDLLIFAEILTKYVLCVLHTLVCDHDVIIVSITDTQYIGGHTVTSTGLDKSLHSFEMLHSDHNNPVN